MPHIQVDRRQPLFLESGPDREPRLGWGLSFRSVPATEPGVLQRLVPEGEEPPSLVFTAFAPAAEAPSSYPADLPFLPNLLVWTTEYLSGEQPPGARWEGDADPARVLAALVEHSLAEGWTAAEEMREFPFPVCIEQVVLRRGAWVRWLLAVSLGAESIVQLQDLPTQVFRGGARPGA